MPGIIVAFLGGAKWASGRLARDEQTAHPGYQGAGAFLQPVGAHIGNRVRTHQVREVRRSHQPGVGPGCVGENRSDDGGRGQALAFQRHSVVQTARRAAPSIADAGNHEVGVAVQIGQHFRVGGQRCVMLADIVNVGKLELAVQGAGDGPEDGIGVGLGVVQQAQAAAAQVNGPGGQARGRSPGSNPVGSISGTAPAPVLVVVISRLPSKVHHLYCISCISPPG